MKFVIFYKKNNFLWLSRQNTCRMFMHRYTMAILYRTYFCRIYEDTFIHGFLTLYQDVIWYGYKTPCLCWRICNDTTRHGEYRLTYILIVHGIIRIRWTNNNKYIIHV